MEISLFCNRLLNYFRITRKRKTNWIFSVLMLPVSSGLGQKVCLMLRLNAQSVKQKHVFNANFFTMKVNNAKRNRLLSKSLLRWIIKVERKVLHCAHNAEWLSLKMEDVTILLVVIYNVLMNSVGFVKKNMNICIFVRQILKNANGSLNLVVKNKKQMMNKDRSF